MSTIDNLAKDFLAQERIAVAGVSSEREQPANLIYKTLRERGYTVYAINPHTSGFLGDPCYPDVFSLPAKPDGLARCNSSARTSGTRACAASCGRPERSRSGRADAIRRLLPPPQELTAGEASPAAKRGKEDG